MPNERRGEVEVVLDGKPLTLRPSFEALVEIEQRLGLTLAEVGARALAGSLGLQHVAVIIWAGARAADADGAPSLIEIGEAVVEAGYSSFLVNPDESVEGARQSLADFICRGLGWTGEPEKKSPAKTKAKAAAKN